MAGFYSRKLMDYDGETSTVNVHAAEITPANMADQVTAQANFGSAINDVVLGSLQSIRYGNGVMLSNAAPDVVYSQRELKWRVNYRDVTNGSRNYFTIPTADLSFLDDQRRGYMDLTSTEALALVAATEAYVLSPDGNAVEVVDIEFVGRNL